MKNFDLANFFFRETADFTKSKVDCTCTYYPSTMYYTSTLLPNLSDFFLFLICSNSPWNRRKPCCLRRWEGERGESERTIIQEVEEKPIFLTPRKEEVEGGEERRGGGEKVGKKS